MCSQRKERLFDGEGLKRLSGSEAKTRPERKNARNAAAGGRGAARQGAPRPHAPSPLPSLRAADRPVSAGATANSLSGDLARGYFGVPNFHI